MSRQPVKTKLYLGLEPPPNGPGEFLIHLPVISIAPRPSTTPSIIRFYEGLLSYTHLIFTSKSAVHLFFSSLPSPLENKKIIAVGKSTAAVLEKYQTSTPLIATNETAEGVCDLLLSELSPSHHFAWPHSALSRPILLNFFNTHKCKYTDCIFYDTHTISPPNPPCLDSIDEIIFTSPSTIQGFLNIYHAIPWHKTLTTLGPITKKALFLLRD